MMRIIKIKIKIYLYSKIESTNKDKKVIAFIRNNIWKSGWHIEIKNIRNIELENYKFEVRWLIKNKSKYFNNFKKEYDK